MSADLLRGETVTVPSHDMELRDGGDRVVVRWRLRGGRVRARSLWRVATDDRVAVLVALDAWAVSQRSVPVPELSVTLDDVPDGILLALRGAGFTPAERAPEEIDGERRSLAGYSE